jgi:hypothetical protein
MDLQYFAYCESERGEVTQPDALALPAQPRRSSDDGRGGVDRQRRVAFSQPAQAPAGRSGRETELPVLGQEHAAAAAAATTGAAAASYCPSAVLPPDVASPPATTASMTALSPPLPPASTASAATAAPAAAGASDNRHPQPHQQPQQPHTARAIEPTSAAPTQYGPAPSSRGSHSWQREETAAAAPRRVDRRRRRPPPAVPPPAIRVSPGTRGSGYMAEVELRCLMPVSPEAVFGLLTHPGTTRLGRDGWRGRGRLRRVRRSGGLMSGVSEGYRIGDGEVEMVRCVTREVWRGRG